MPQTAEMVSGPLAVRLTHLLRWTRAKIFGVSKGSAGQGLRAVKFTGDGGDQDADFLLRRVECRNRAIVNSGIGAS